MSRFLSDEHGILASQPIVSRLLKQLSLPRKVDAYLGDKSNHFVVPDELQRRVSELIS